MPALYDLRVCLLRGDEQVDQVDTYFGMRKVERRGGRVYLNNCPLYQKLILDQGYWPASLTNPDDLNIWKGGIQDDCAPDTRRGIQALSGVVCAGI